jgi:hypothetical protein
MQHTQNSNVGIITAHRGTLDAATNKSRNSALAGDIRKAGYGFAHIRGRYIENYGKPDARPVDEHSFLVIGKKGNDSGNLKGTLKHLGKKYDQDSVLHKAHNEPHANLIGTKEGTFPGEGKEHNVGQFHANRFSEFHSMLKDNKKGFTFEEWNEFAVYNPITFSSRTETLF